MANFTSVLCQLELERSRLASQLERLNQALSAPNGVNRVRTGRRMSVAGRARIAAAQRARWAKTKGRKVVVISAAKKTMSPGRPEEDRCRTESALGEVEIIKTAQSNAASSAFSSHHSATGSQKGAMRRNLFMLLVRA